MEKSSCRQALLCVNEVFHDFEIQCDAVQINQSESCDGTELN